MSIAVYLEDPFDFSKTTITSYALFGSWTPLIKFHVLAFIEWFHLQQSDLKLEYAFYINSTLFSCTCSTISIWVKIDAAVLSSLRLNYSRYDDSLMCSHIAEEYYRYHSFIILQVLCCRLLKEGNNRQYVFLSSTFSLDF